jgi:hypothetical protein
LQRTSFDVTEAVYTAYDVTQLALQGLNSLQEYKGQDLIYCSNGNKLKWRFCEMALKPLICEQIQKFSSSGQGIGLPSEDIAEIRF